MHPLPPPADGDFSRGPTILAIAIISMTVAFFSVFTRLYIRTLMTKNLWWDDGLIVAGLVRQLPVQTHTQI